MLRFEFTAIARERDGVRMRGQLALAMLCMAGAIVGVKAIEATGVVQGGAGEKASAPHAAALSPASEQASYRPGWRREIRIPADHHRQFMAHANVNRQSTNFLIDTGAAFVALRESDARRAFIYTRPEDYTAPVMTANGKTKAARVKVDVIEIGGITIRGVEAMILPDEQLSINLLGMSFLSQVPSVEARGGEMILRG